MVLNTTTRPFIHARVHYWGPRVDVRKFFHIRWGPDLRDSVIYDRAKSTKDDWLSVPAKSDQPA